MGEILGEVEEVDVDEDVVGWGPFLRVWVWIDISKPLLRGNLISIEDSPHWIPFKYKRLPKFCFRCGSIRHAKSGCIKGPNVNKLHDAELPQYGAWLRASPTKIL